MAHDERGCGRLSLLIVLLGAIGATEAAEAQSQPPASPPIINVKVRPSSDQSGSDGAPTHERMTDRGNGILNASDAKRVRTTRERVTDDSAPPAIAPLQPPPARP